MEPKFQSSFIPKGPVAMAGTMPKSRQTRVGGLYGYIAMIIFAISVILAIGVFGYQFYVKGTINSMSLEIANNQDTLIPNTAREFIRLNDRIKATQELINNHVVVSPLFDYLEESTLKGIRFTEFSYNTAPGGVTLILKGEATGYATVALQADIFNKGTYFKDSNFSDLKLDNRGNVTFVFQTRVDPTLISYQRQVEGITASQKPAVVPPVATTTESVATSTSVTNTPETAPSTSSGQATTSSTTN